MKEKKTYLIYLVMLACMPPLATDMYLPAIPTIANELDTAKSTINLSLVLWFASFSASLLFMGPVSDKLGRKPVLFTGLIIFIASSLLCSTSTNASQLIFFRILQGIGAAAPSAMVMAIVKDKYDGDMRKVMLAYIGTILMVVPMLAPSAGALFLEYFSWKAIFIAQGLITCIPLFFTFFFKETNKNKIDTHFSRLLGRYKVHLVNGNYMKANLSMGLLVAPFYGFLGFSTIAYIVHFGLSEKLFGILFASNALMSMAGSFLCSKLVSRINGLKLLQICIIGCTVGGFLLFAAGNTHYLAFAGFMLIISFFGGMSRPLSNDLILRQVDSDIGSASSFIVFYQFIAGSCVMALVTQNWSRPFAVFGGVAFFLPLFVFYVWSFRMKDLKESYGE